MRRNLTLAVTQITTTLDREIALHFPEITDATQRRRVANAIARNLVTAIDEYGRTDPLDGIPEHDRCATCHGSGCADCGTTGLEHESITHGMRR